MTYATYTPYAFTPSYRRRVAWKIIPQDFFDAAAISCGVLLGAWLLYAPPAETPRIDAAPAPTRAVAQPDIALLDPTYSLGGAPVAFGQEAPLGASFVPFVRPAPIVEAENAPSATPEPVETIPVPAPRPPDLQLANQDVPLAPSAGLIAPPARTPSTAAPENLLPASSPAAPEVTRSVPLPNVPLPAPRPTDLRLAASEHAPLEANPRSIAPSVPAAPIPQPESARPVPNPPQPRLAANEASLNPTSRRLAQQDTRQAPPDNRSLFQKLFGAQQQQQQRGPVLAYAAPEDEGLRTRPSVASAPVAADRWTAVYDISAHTVYMPNGGRLEAHSGLGYRLDDPRYVNERNRGATPPHVYELTPRGQLFHGVQALRLNPVGPGTVYGRSGLLAHTFMLGPQGASNGCVSFRNYNAFLQAYSNGEVRRLLVVAHLS